MQYNNVLLCGKAEIDKWFAGIYHKMTYKNKFDKKIELVVSSFTFNIVAKY